MGCGSLEICHIFTDPIIFKQQIYCSLWEWGVWVGGKGVVCECHHCMILNIKTYFDKKVTILALVPVL